MLLCCAGPCPRPGSWAWVTVSRIVQVMTDEDGRLWDCAQFCVLKGECEYSHGVAEMKCRINRLWVARGAVLEWVQTCNWCVFYTVLFIYLHLLNQQQNATNITNISCRIPGWWTSSGHSSSKFLDHPPPEVQLSSPGPHIQPPSLMHCPLTNFKVLLIHF